MGLYLWIEQRFALLVLLCLSATLLVYAGCRQLHAEAPPGGPLEGTHPVVVELFTSQGCSSCPSADRVLTELGRDPALAGRVLPLSFHVDYWNYLGWVDPYASEAWSQRQRRYGKAMGTDRIYTPQLVVDGRSHLIGSRRGEVMDAISKASMKPPAGDITLNLSKIDGALMADVSTKITRGVPGDGLVLVLVVFENGHTTRVLRGENAGRSLSHDHVVRSLKPVAEVPARVGATAKRKARLVMDPAWNMARVGVVALLQDPATMHIHAAAIARP